MIDLRAERRAIAAQAMAAIISKLPLLDREGSLGLHTSLATLRGLRADVAESAMNYADALIEFDRDNHPSSKALKESLTTEGWIHHSERLPTEADAPVGWIHICDKEGLRDIIRLKEYLKTISLHKTWCYWHPATSRFQIPKVPEVPR